MILKVTLNGKTYNTISTPGIIDILKNFNVPAEVGSYTLGNFTIDITDGSTDPDCLNDFKNSLIDQARAKAADAIKDKYDTLEIAVIALFQSQQPTKAQTARDAISSIVTALNSKLIEIRAATTYEQLSAIVI